MTLFGDAPLEIKRKPFDKLKEFLLTRENSSYKKLALLTESADLLSLVLNLTDHIMTTGYEHTNPEHRQLREALDELEDMIRGAR